MSTFQIGQPVRKVTGRYHPPGTFRGEVTTEAGDVRVVVEHAHGMLHIYAPEQIAADDSAEILRCEGASIAWEIERQINRSPFSSPTVGLTPEVWVKVTALLRGFGL